MRAKSTCNIKYSTQFQLHLVSTYFILFLGTRQVFNLAPFTRKDLQLRSLRHRLEDLQQMKTLYPDIGKETVLSLLPQDTTPLGVPMWQSEKGGYIRAEVRTQLVQIDLG